MKVIGLIGGLSWESSALYYQIVNQSVRERMGGLHSAKSLLYSFDFFEIEALQHADRWDEASARMIDAAQRLERGGADFFVICSNTMHRMADEVVAAVSIPLLHIADPTAEAIRAAGFERVGLLGTRYTMEAEFYRGRLESQHGLTVLTPDEVSRAVVHRVIYEELVRGEVRSDSRAALQKVIAELVDQGAQCVILGCTEITLLVKPEHSPVPVFDTTKLHAEAVVTFALAESEGVLV
ncbi:MAG: aspartate/glutamate racemase family protein [Anaerolineae bacterium]